MKQPNDYETESQEMNEMNAFLRDSEDSTVDWEKDNPSKFERLIGWITVLSATVLWAGFVVYLGYWLAK